METCTLQSITREEKQFTKLYIAWVQFLWGETYWYMHMKKIWKHIYQSVNYNLKNGHQRAESKKRDLHFLCLHFKTVLVFSMILNSILKLIKGVSSNIPFPGGMSSWYLYLCLLLSLVWAPGSGIDIRNVCWAKKETPQLLSETFFIYTVFWPHHMACKIFSSLTKVWTQTPSSGSMRA